LKERKKELERFKFFICIILWLNDEKRFRCKRNIEIKYYKKVKIQTFFIFMGGGGAITSRIFAFRGCFGN